MSSYKSRPVSINGDWRDCITIILCLFTSVSGPILESHSVHHVIKITSILSPLVVIRATESIIGFFFPVDFIIIIYWWIVIFLFFNKFFRFRVKTISSIKM